MTTFRKIPPIVTDPPGRLSGQYLGLFFAKALILKLERRRITSPEEAEHVESPPADQK
jgi:hypothetical protein